MERRTPQLLRRKAPPSQWGGNSRKEKEVFLKVWEMGRLIPKRINPKINPPSAQERFSSPQNKELIGIKNISPPNSSLKFFGPGLGKEP